MNNIVTTYKSRSGGIDHVIRQNDFGQLYCTCLAAQYELECWAIKLVRPKFEMEKFNRKIRELEGTQIKIPDKQKLIWESWAESDRCKYLYELTHPGQQLTFW